MSTTTAPKFRAPIKKSETTLILWGRLSYPSLFEAKAVNGSADKKFSVSLIISKDDAVTIATIKEAQLHLENEARDKFKIKKGTPMPTSFKFPLRDGDIDRSSDESYENSFFLGANCKTKPQVINSKKEVITDPDELYPGCYGYISVNFYVFDASGNKGIACGLNNVMKVVEGERLAGRPSANEDFADVAVEDGEEAEDFM